MVKPEEVSEDNMILLAREIAKKIESELEYPGQIKVNVIRETKAVEYAECVCGRLQQAVGVFVIFVCSGAWVSPAPTRRTRRGHAGGSVQNLHSNAWGPPTSFHDREKEPSAHTRACFPSRGTHPALQTKNLTPLPPPALSRSQNGRSRRSALTARRPPPVRMPRRTLFRPAPRQ